VNELPAKLKKSTKPRLLSLSKEASCLIQQGFEKVFNEDIFKFRLFGLSYYLLPSIFFNEKSRVIESMKRAAKEAIHGDLKEKMVLEKRLELLVKELEDAKLSQKMLFTFLFASKNNNAIDLYQTIEDVAPSRIRFAKTVMSENDIDASNLSKYIKKSEYDENMLYIRDYIADPLLLAKLIFGKEHLASREKLYAIVNRKIRFGNNLLSNENRSLSKIMNSYYKADTDFKKHQRFLDFLSALGAVTFPTKNLISGEEMNEVESFKNLVEAKFTGVELFQNRRAREFYIVGALAQFVMRWQHSKDSDTVAKYLDSIGAVTMQNIDRVFRKVIDGAKKYSMYGEEFDALLSLYSALKSELKSSDVVSIDKANIAFVMGGIDYKNYKSHKKGEEQ
jgi:hypothetical protein